VDFPITSELNTTFNFWLSIQFCGQCCLEQDPKVYPEKNLLPLIQWEGKSCFYLREFYVKQQPIFPPLFLRIQGNYVQFNSSFRL